MKRPLLAVLVAVTSTACGAPRAAPITGDISSALARGIADGSARFDHSSWDELVQRHVRDGGRRFDYVGLKADERQFEAYLGALANADLSALSANEIQALFANAYNAYTIKTILDHVSADGTFDIESIRDVPDVFGRKNHNVGSFSLSLDNMEHNVLRPLFKDPRLHFAVNCASISCPPLPMHAFTGDEIDEQLDTVTKNALTNTDYVSVDGDALLVTKIMDWYGGDFVNPEYTGSEKTLPEFIAKYATDEVRELVATRGDSVTVKFRDYDWGLNKP
ncbi:MAG: hypothetical protein BMS9Abin37_1780 [Acidobacteriota bacterium]|nr:MAG: hypothetical protein BMS9Abin37_1780 [Acidobacteriota bacterium]